MQSVRATVIAGGVLMSTLSAFAQEEPRSVEANGITFSYLEAGRGPLVLCLHGFPDTPHTWDLLLPRLAAAGYRAVAPWLRGYHPSSSPADGDYSARALGQDVLALIAALGEERAIVIGHDWGAMAGYAAASLEPARIEKLVTVAIPHPSAVRLDGSFLRRSWHFFYYGLLPWYPTRALEKERGVGSVPWIYARWSPGWNPGAEELAHVRRSFDGPRGNGSGLAGPIAYYRAFAQLALRPAERRFLQRPTSVPTLTILGRRDGALGLRDPERTRAGFSGPYTLLLLDVGHFVQREAPEDFARAVFAFIGGERAGLAGRAGD